MKRIILFFLLIVSTISLSAQSEEWKEYCQLQFKAQSAFKKGDYQKASKSYSQMDSVYGKIVDYADMRNYCIAAANESMWLQPVDIEKTKANIVEYE